jgi:hypothetical protein
LTFEQNIICNFYYINSIRTQTVYKFYNLRGVKNFTIPLKDEYFDIAASIKESEIGDFFELSAIYQSQNIENLILS